MAEKLPHQRRIKTPEVETSENARKKVKHTLDRRSFLAGTAAGLTIGATGMWGLLQPKKKPKPSPAPSGETETIERATEAEPESHFSLQVHDLYEDGSEVPEDKESIYGVEVPRISLERKQALFAKYDAQIATPNLTKEQRQEKWEEAEKLTQKTGKVHGVDEGCTGNILSFRHEWQSLLDEPLVSFQIPGHPHRIELREEIAVRFLAAIDDYRTETRKNPNLNKETSKRKPYLRSNEDQMEDWQQYKRGEGPVAANPYSGMHVKGMAVDLGGNWETYEPYFKRYGFIGGYNNGIWDDEHHFDIGRRKKPATPSEMAELEREFKELKKEAKKAAGKVGKEAKELGKKAKKEGKKLLKKGGKKAKKLWKKRPKWLK